ncbi:MAG: DegT/DnrJ/EryC1/StrS family aminotransferase [Pseudomonadota bacterium]
MSKEVLYVTRPSLPPAEELQPLIDSIWSSRFVTNGGPIHQRFSRALEEYLDVPHVTLVANATLGVMLGLKQLMGDEGGEVITPAFSFVATSHAAKWAGADLVFADIDARTLNIDPAEVERLITPRTKAILAVHCYGNACDAAALQDIADRHNIALIYDGAHCFAATDTGGSLLRHGDLSVVSFHATKVFSTLEGGAIISHDADTKQALDRLINYGIVNETTIDTTGFNAKMSEMHAAVGLAQLPHVAKDIERRSVLSKRYWEQLKDIPGLHCVCPWDDPGRNYYIFPILVGPGYPMSCSELYERLKEQKIFARRYFYPLLTQLPMYRDLPSADPAGLPRSMAAAEQVLCLPLYPDLAFEDQDRVLDAITEICVPRKDGQVA